MGRTNHIFPSDTTMTAYKKTSPKIILLLGVYSSLPWDVFSEALPSYNKRETHTDTQRARGFHKPTFIFAKYGK
jgi:hypothetical protein